MDKPDFRGKEALIQKQAESLQRKLVMFSLEDPDWAKLFEFAFGKQYGCARQGTVENDFIGPWGGVGVEDCLAQTSG